MVPFARPTERVVSPGVSLKERIAALQQRNGSISPPNSSPPAKVASNSLQGAGALRDKIARFEVKGGVPVPRGSFGLGAPPVREDFALRRKGELYGNRVVSANAGKFQPPSGVNKDGGQLSLHTSDGSPVQRKRCISTSVLGRYVPDTIARLDPSSLSISIDEADSNTISEAHSPVIESPTRPYRRGSVSDVTPKRVSILADGLEYNTIHKVDSILFATSSSRGPATPPSPSRTITQELTDATVADESSVVIDADDALVAQRDELAELPKEEPDAEDEDRRHDAHQEIFPESVAASTNDKVHVISSTVADDIPHLPDADKLDLDDPLPNEELKSSATSTSDVDPAPPKPSTPEHADVIPEEPALAEPEADTEPNNQNDPPPLAPSPLPSPSLSSEDLNLPSHDETPQAHSPLHDASSVSQSSVDPEDIPPYSDDEVSRVKEADSPILHSQSMPAIILSNGAAAQEDTAHTNGSVSPATHSSSSLRRSRSPNPIVVPSIPEQTYTELTLERTTGPKSFKAVVHGRKTHTKTPSPVDHQTQVVAPLNLRKGRTQGSSTRRQQGAIPTSPRTPNSPDLSLLVAQAAQLEERLSGEPEEEEDVPEVENVQEIMVEQHVIMNQNTSNLEVDEFGQGPPISPSLQSLISNSSNDSKRRRSKSNKSRLPAIDATGVPPTPPPKSAHWFKTLPASILSRNQSMSSQSIEDRQSRASWSSEKSSENSSAITTPPSPTFDLVTLPLAEDQFNHPGYRFGGRRSSSISSSSVLSSPKKSPSKKLMSRSSTFMNRMLSRAGKSSSTLALPGNYRQIKRTHITDYSYRRQWINIRYPQSFLA